MLDKIAADNKEKQRRGEAGLPETIPATPTSPKEIYTNVYTQDKGSATAPPGQDTFLADIALPIAYTFAGGTDSSRDAVNTAYDYYYKADQGGKYGDAFITELNTKKTGLFLSPIPNLRSTWQLVPAQNYPEVVLSAGALNVAAIRNTFRDRFGFIDLSDKNLLGANAFIKTFDNALYKYPAATTALGAIAEAFTGTETIAPDDFVYPQSNDLIAYITQVANVIDPITKSNTGRLFDLKITYKALPLPTKGDTELEAKDKLLRPKRKEIIAALENWFNTSRRVQILSIEPNRLPVDPAEPVSGRSLRVTVKGTITFPIPKKGTEVILDVEFTNTALIQSVLASPVVEGTPKDATQNGDAGDNGGTDNQSTPSQTDAGFKFASALHAMLAAVKARVEYTMDSDQRLVVDIPLLDLTKKFYQGSILENLFTTQESTNQSEFDLIQYARKGFNSNLMVNYKKDPELFKLVKTVDFESLCKAYGIRWQIQTGTNKINNPSYLKLGYILSFLNAMCLIYDSTVDTDKHPYVYLDFNPYTNFCLTTPQHMSVDPFTCMIPYQGTQEDYLRLFPPDIAPNPDPKSITIFNENLNVVSGYIPKFKASNNPYQGSTMEILLNVDFLISTLDARTTNSPDHTVDLKGFLDDIMTGINKATGNLNSFRVSYRDDSNTVIIKDDQFVPPIDGEPWAMSTQATQGKKLENYGDVPNGVNVPKYGQLPIFGKYSLVREMRLETDMSTKMSNVIAISGQSNTDSVNSTDHSSLSWLNSNFQDRYKPKISDSSNTNSQNSSNNTTEEDRKKQEQDANKAAHEFNEYIVSIYNGRPISEKTVSTAVNYYINGIAQVKSKDRITLAAPFIPANLNITIDGIGGIIMGNAFTIPENRLPLSLRGQGGVDRNTKVGFVVVGLTHTLDNNQWLTKIRGQMIKLRDSIDYGSTAALKDLQNTFIAAPTNVIPANVTIPSGPSRINVVNAVKALNTTTGVKALMLAQIGVEGYYPDTLAYRTNNPGNVRSGGKQRSFPTLADGVQAMLGVTNNAIQKRGYYTKVVTLLDYINVYAPPFENKPNEYVSLILGYFRKIGLTQFNANSTINQIAAYNGAINFV
jgi:hypothetical protein